MYGNSQCSKDGGNLGHCQREEDIGARKSRTLTYISRASDTGNEATERKI